MAKATGYRGGSDAPFVKVVSALSKEDRLRFLIKYAKLFSATHQRHPSRHYGRFIKKKKPRSYEDELKPDRQIIGDDAKE
jgi:hypothetical protein